MVLSAADAAAAKPDDATGRHEVNQFPIGSSDVDAIRLVDRLVAGR